jgi:hypothetical protein
MYVAILSLRQSPVNCRSRNDRGIFTQKVNYRYYFHSPTMEIYTHLKAQRVFPLDNDEMVEFSE